MQPGPGMLMKRIQILILLMAACVFASAGCRGCRAPDKSPIFKKSRGDKIPKGADPGIYSAPFDHRKILKLDNDTRLVADQVLVAFKPGTGRKQAESVARKHRLKIVGEIRPIAAYQFEIADETPPEDMARALEEHELVDAASPNLVMDTAMVPDEMDVSLAAVKKAWLDYEGLNNNFYEFVNTRAFEAWDMGTGSEDGRIALVDSGIYDPWENPTVGRAMRNTLQREFGDRLESGYDFAEADNEPLTGPEDGSHGTALAGIAAAQGDNGNKTFGVCWDCPIMSVRSHSREGGTVFSVAAGLAYAASHGARVINLGAALYTRMLGWPLGQDWWWALRRAVNYAFEDRDCLVVAPAGNGNRNLQDLEPSLFVNVLTVGAVDNNDARHPLSNFGKLVNIAAPGVELTTTRFGAQPGQTHGYCTGTSCAAAFVSGGAALLRSINPSLTAVQVRHILLTTADKIKPDMPMGHACYGEKDQDAGYIGCRINLWRAAVQAADVSGIEIDLSFKEEYTYFEDVTALLIRDGRETPAAAYRRTDTHDFLSASLPPGEYSLLITKGRAEIYNEEITLTLGKLKQLKIVSDYKDPEIKIKPEKKPGQETGTDADEKPVLPDETSVDHNAMDVILNLLKAAKSNDYQAMADLVDYQWLYDTMKEKAPEKMAQKNIETMAAFKQYTVDSGLFVEIAKDISKIHDSLTELTSEIQSPDANLEDYLPMLVRVERQDDTAEVLTVDSDQPLFNLRRTGDDWKIYFPNFADNIE